MQQAAELAVPRHPELTTAQDVQLRHIHVRAGIGPLERLQPLREVVQCDQARVRRAERVDDVGQLLAPQDRNGLRPGQFAEGPWPERRRVVAYRPEVEVVWHE